MTGRTILKLEVMNNSCWSTGAGVTAPKGTSRSLGTFITDITFSFSFLRLNPYLSAAPEICGPSLTKFLDFHFIVSTIQSCHVRDNLCQTVFLHHAGHLGHCPKYRGGN